MMNLFPHPSNANAINGDTFIPAMEKTMPASLPPAAHTEPPPPSGLAAPKEAAPAYTETPASTFSGIIEAPVNGGTTPNMPAIPTSNASNNENTSKDLNTNGTSTSANLTTNGHPTTNGHTTTNPTTTPPTPQTLTGKVALVTGASRGIGAGIALELASRGCSIIVNYVKGSDAAARMVSSILNLNTGASALAIQADVSSVPEITRLFEESIAHFGHLDIVCSNSGMESFDKTLDITEERFDLVMGLNFRAQFFVAQHAYRYLREGGRVVLMSSIAAGLIGVGDHALYSASKSAVNGVTKSFAKDFGQRGITVNAIAPGGVKSDMFTQVAWRYIPGATGEWSAEKIENEMANACPLGRCAEPVDVARVVASLVGPDGGWINGQIITISGGSGQ